MGIIINCGEGKTGGGGVVVILEDGTTIPNPVLISKRQYHPLSRGCPSLELVVGATLGKQQQTTDPETGAAYRQACKRKRIVADGDEETNTLQSQLIEVLEQNGRMVSEQLESQNTNFQLDREQRRDHVNNLVVVFSKLTDALGRIADKL
ncbi:hypothetical protein Vadar_001518 [Vaccinium darrowii]|uniref:Uncharacterized protein n=1 Tax=Vaccinium darrowii TaxID=229202 RepID=A0ACB7YS85_9ERIC|nr:hypothetical protein Vadar_001518 [Vaccinium darrowii]